MASKISITRAASLSLLLLLLGNISIICLEAKKLLKTTNMVFYMHDWETPTKESNTTTSIPVAGDPKLKNLSIVNFGTILTIDDAVTLDIHRNSTEIARLRGIYVSSALDSTELYFLMSVVFTNKKYNGSTIEIQGSDRFYLKYRDVSVVSGTGYFRLARGWATLETVFLDVPNLNAIVRWNLTVFHY